MMLPRLEACPALGRGQAAAGARIKRRPLRIVPLRWRDGGGYLGPRAEAGIDQLLLFQRRQRLAVPRRMLALAHRRPVKGDAEPRQILDHALGMDRPAADGIDILDAQKQAAAGLAGQALAEHRRIGMTEMELAIGAWREAENRRAGGVCGHPPAIIRLRRAGQIARVRSPPAQPSPA